MHLTDSSSTFPVSHPPEYVQLFVEHTPSAIAMFDREMRYLMVSRRWLQDYELGEADIIGKSHYDIFPEISNEWKAIHQKCLQGAIERCEEEAFPRANGYTDWLRWEIHPWHHASGDIGGLIMFTEVITDRKRAEFALEEANLALKNANKRLQAQAAQHKAELDNFFTLSADMFCVAGFDGHFKRTNPAFEKVLGYTQAELLAEPFLSFVHPDDQTATYEQAQKLTRGQEVISFENRYRCKDGSYRWLSWTSVSDPKAQAIYATARNITEQKQVEVTLKRQAQLIDQVKGGIVSTDLTGIITSWSKGAEALYRYTAAEIIGQPISILYPKHLYTFLQSAIVVPLQALGHHQVETRNRDKLGYEFDVFLSLSIERDQEGQAIGMISYAQDISDRKQAETEILELKNLYEQILDAISDMVLCKGPESKLLYGNKAFRDYYGMTNEQLKGLIDAPHVKPDYTQQYVKDDAYVFNTGKRLVIEEPVIRHDGIERIFSTIKNAIFDAQGEVIQTVGVSHDITEQKTANTRLKEQEQFLRSIFNSSHIIFVVDINELGEFRYTGWNQAVERATSISKDVVLGKTPDEAFGPEVGENFLKRYRQCVEAKEALVYEEAFDNRWWLTTLTPLFDDHNRAYRLVGTASNISDRKRAEEKLATQTQRDRLLNQLTQQIRNTLDFDEILDTAVREIQEYLQVDRCHFAWYVEIEETAYWDVISEVQAPNLPSFLGRHAVEAFGPLSNLMLRQEILRLDNIADCAYPNVRQVLQALGNRSMLVLPIFANSGQFGIIACIQSQAVRPWSDDEVELLEAIATQLTIALNQAELYQESVSKAQELEQAMGELRRTQSQMIQAEKMSSLGQLVAGVAHEINNPVNFIYGNLSYAREYTQDLLNLVGLYQTHYPDPHVDISKEADAIDLEFLMQDLPKLLNSMKVGANRIQGIVTSLRTFSRMDEAEYKAIHLQDGIDSTLMILHNRIKPKSDRPGIEVIQNFGNLPKVECYAGQLNQVFMNLICNAIDALEEARNSSQMGDKSPQISIRTALLDDQHVQVAIADNGPGIPTAVQARIFDPFFTTKPVGKGTGMGLSISYQIVTDKHNGQLECHSTLGQGTTFLVTIPLSQTPNTRKR